LSFSLQLGFSCHFRNQIPDFLFPSSDFQCKLTSTPTRKDKTKKERRKFEMSDEAASPWALHDAAFDGDVELIKALVKSGYKLDSLDEEGGKMLAMY
jgi:hypothetical protein